MLSIAPKFTVIIPARLASSRLPNKPLADIEGEPMIVRVAKRAASSLASQIVVACDHPSIEQACKEHQIKAVLTREDHFSGSDRLAQACEILELPDTDIVVNVQGDEPLIEQSMINSVAYLLATDEALHMSTAAHAIHDAAEFLNPNVVKVVLDEHSKALYFSRAPIPWSRDEFSQGVHQLPSTPVLRHVGIYGYRVGFLKKFPQLKPTLLERVEALEQLRALSHGYGIGVHVSESDPGPGVDTPEDLERVRKIFRSARAN
jgi:3-deoxy-manno-octulosonate cytidylyltransferase (CMP-KDO synthetase)